MNPNFHIPQILSLGSVFIHTFIIPAIMVAQAAEPWENQVLQGKNYYT